AVLHGRDDDRNFKSDSQRRDSSELRLSQLNQCIGFRAGLVIIRFVGVWGVLLRSLALITRGLSFLRISSFYFDDRAFDFITANFFGVLPRLRQSATHNHHDEMHADSPAYG